MHGVFLKPAVCMLLMQAIQQNYQTILNTDCTNLQNTLQQPQYGTPSAE